MSVVAPKGRKHLCADALFRLLHEHFATIVDDDVDEGEIPLDDTLMSAFAMFSLKAPSLLAFDKQRAEGNLKTIYGIARAPCDTWMRERLDPVAPESLRPSFTLVFRQLQRGKALEPMVFLDGHYLVALDGTGYFSSTTIHCDSCLHKEHRNGSVTYYHQILGAAIIHPDFREVIPLMPEPIVKQDGTEKNDCERNAAKRFITKLRQETVARLVDLATTGVTTFAVSNKGITPICSSRCRRPKQRDASPTMSGMTALLGWCIGFALSTTCRSMAREQTCGSISSSTGR